MRLAVALGGLLAIAALTAGCDVVGELTLRPDGVLEYDVVWTTTDPDAFGGNQCDSFSFGVVVEAIKDPVTDEFRGCRTTGELDPTMVAEPTNDNVLRQVVWVRPGETQLLMLNDSLAEFVRSQPSETGFELSVTMPGPVIDHSGGKLDFWGHRVTWTRDDLADRRPLYVEARQPGSMPAWAEPWLFGPGAFLAGAALGWGGLALRHRSRTRAIAKADAEAARLAALPPPPEDPAVWSRPVEPDADAPAPPELP